jgi:hypothetical protein
MSVLIAAVIAVSVTGAQAEQMAARENLEAWAEDFKGDWSSESLVDEDTEILKAGDKIVAHWSTEWTPDKVVLSTHYWAEVDGATFVTVRALVGWDPLEKALVTHWYSSLGGAGKIVYRKDGENWVAKWSTADPEGKKRSWTAHIRFVDENTQETTNTDRIINGERKPDQKVIAKRK